MGSVQTVMTEGVGVFLKNNLLLIGLLAALIVVLVLVVVLLRGRSKSNRAANQHSEPSESSAMRGAISISQPDFDMEIPVVNPQTDDEKTRPTYSDSSFSDGQRFSFSNDSGEATGNPYHDALEKSGDFVDPVAMNTQFVSQEEKTINPYTDDTEEKTINPYAYQRKIYKITLEIQEVDSDGKPFPPSVRRLNLEEEKKFTIGRGKTADVVLRPLYISRIHLECSATAEGVLIQKVRADEGANYTFLNGKDMEQNKPYPLQCGDEIRVLDTTLRVSELAN